MTQRRTAPKHGTIRRYRLELREQKEGKGSGPCDRCRSANSARVKNARANRNATERRAKLTIVEPVTSSEHIQAPEPETPAAPRGNQRGRRTLGEMEKAVEADIDEIDEQLQVPFHRSLSVLARQLAKEIDDAATPANVRAQSSRQLFEVLRSLRTQKEGDDNSAVAVALQAAGFGVPLVP